MKAIDKDTLSIGQIVVVTDSEQTQVYTVAHIFGNTITLQWQEGTRICSQGYRGPVFAPSLTQIEYSIANNGPLLSKSDLVAWA